jgi:hypothetical protein
MKENNVHIPKHIDVVPDTDRSCSNSDSGVGYYFFRDGGSQ